MNDPEVNNLNNEEVDPLLNGIETGLEIFTLVRELGITLSSEQLDYATNLAYEKGIGEVSQYLLTIR